MADFELLDALTPLQPSELPRQWRLGRSAEAGYPGWTHLTLGHWHLQAHPDAKVATAVDRNGAPVGWIIEALRQDRSDPGRQMVLDLGQDCSEAEVDRALYGRGGDGRIAATRLEGPWTAIIVMGRPRVYVAAAHSVIYAPDRECVAATPNPIPHLVRDRELSHVVDPRVTKAFYGFGLTPYHGVKRLLPNHLLDLETFAPVRHWPPPGLAPYSSERDAADRLIAGVAPVLLDIGSRFDRVRISLSAGRDSRAVLALCRALIAEAPDKVTTFTTMRGDVWSRVDAATAAELAARAGIRHEVLGTTPRSAEPCEEDIARAFVRFGEAKWGPFLMNAAASERPRYAGWKIHLPGMGGELARGYYWGGKMPRGPDITPPALLGRVGMPAVPQTVAAATAWLEGLPAGVRSRPTDVLDLLYLEQRVGCWSAPTRYLFRGGGTTLNLMLTGAGVDAMLRLEPEVRLRGTFQQTLVERAWPVMTGLPYNRPSARLRILAAASGGRETAARIGRRLRAEAIAAMTRGRG
jgi:hypothetical protein